MSVRNATMEQMNDTNNTWSGKRNILEEDGEDIGIKPHSLFKACMLIQLMN